MKKLNDQGFVHLHTLLPILIAIVVIGGVGSYVYSKSKASTITTSTSELSCQILTSQKPAQGQSTYYTVKVTNNESTSASNVTINIGMRNGNDGSVIDTLNFGAIGPKQSKTESKDIAFPYGSSLNELYFEGASPSSLNCNKSFFVK